jgi:hypothetical protein
METLSIEEYKKIKLKELQYLENKFFQFPESG